jgi:hypothetical protein
MVLLSIPLNKLPSGLLGTTKGPPESPAQASFFPSKYPAQTMEESISFGLYNVWGTTHFSEGIKGIDKYCKIFEPFLEPEKQSQKLSVI